MPDAHEPRSGGDSWDGGIRHGFRRARLRNGSRATTAEDATTNGRSTRFHLGGEIARDATSVLLRGRDLEMDREVSLRILEAETDVSRFLERIQIGAQLQHPGIVPVYAFGLLEDGRAYVARRLVEGDTFADLVSRDTGSYRLLGILEQAAHALAFAHARGVAHGHVTAERIVVGPHGEVLVTGWDRAVRTNGNPAPMREDVRALGSLLEAQTLLPGRTSPRQAGELARAVGAHLVSEEKRAREAEIEVAREALRAERERAREAAAGRRAESAHRTRRRTRAVLATVLLALLIAAGVSAWRHQESRAAAARIEAEVAAAMREARLREGRGDLAGAQAWAATARARAREAGIPDGSAETLRQRLASERQAADRADRLLSALETHCAEAMESSIPDEAWLVPAPERDAVLARFVARCSAKLDDELTTTFRRHGVDPEVTGPEKALAALGAGERIERFRPHLLRWSRFRVRAGRDATLHGLLTAADLLLHPCLARHRDDYAVLSEAPHLMELPNIVDVQVLQAAVALRPTSPYALYQLALSLDIAAQHTAAREVAERFVRLAPDNGWAHWILSMSCQGLGEPDLAVAAAERAVELQPGNLLFLEGLAAALYVRGSHEEAEAVYRRLLATDSKSFVALARLGRLLHKKGHAAAAVDPLQRAVELEPGSVGAWSNLGLVLADAGRPDEAMDAMQEALRLAPEDPRARNNLGHVLSLREEYAAAVAAYQACLELDPNHIKARVGLGMILCDHLRKYDEAIEHFEAALRLDPELLEARFNIGIALRKKGAHRDALRAFDQALELAPDDFRVLGFRAMSLLALGEPRASAAAWRRSQECAENDTDRAVAHGQLGIVLCDHLRDYEGAVQEFEAALGLVPENAAVRSNLAIALYGLGWLRHQQGRWAEAIVAYRRTLELDPNRPIVLNNLAMLLATIDDPALRDPDEAVELAEKAIALTRGENGIPWNTLSVARYRTGRLREALAALDRSMKLRAGGDAHDWFVLAMVHRKLGDGKQAQEWFDRAVLWMDGQATEDEDLRRLRDEAKAILKGR